MSAKDGSENGNIRQMPRNTAHRLVAGQAITDLASAIKELVDNALDAKAQTISIKLVSNTPNHAPGIDLVEVSDDGTGVPLADRPYLAMKHATSKLANFEDLFSPFATLGFRGEALFSLATLCESLIISTRCEGDVTGEHLTFDSAGQLDARRPVACRVGTTVAFQNLFNTLPVRRLDLIKRAKAQRAQVLKMLQGYAILCRGVQFKVTDVTASKKADIKLVTCAQSVTFENTISSVLGTAFLQDLVRIPTICQSLTADNSAKESQWTLEGLVSRAPMSSTKAAARDLAFLSVNGRPVELVNQVQKSLVNVWRSLFPASKRPAAILALTVPSHMVDVNISPDKRQILLTPEQEICSVLQQTLTQLWSCQVQGVFPSNQVQLMSQQSTLLLQPRSSPKRILQSKVMNDETKASQDQETGTMSLTMSPQEHYEINGRESPIRSSSPPPMSLARAMDRLNSPEARSMVRGTSPLKTASVNQDPIRILALFSHGGSAEPPASNNSIRPELSIRPKILAFRQVKKRDDQVPSCAPKPSTKDSRTRKRPQKPKKHQILKQSDFLQQFAYGDSSTTAQSGQGENDSDSDSDSDIDSEEEQPEVSLSPPPPPSFKRPKVTPVAEEVPCSPHEQQESSMPQESFTAVQDDHDESAEENVLEEVIPKDENNDREPVVWKSFSGINSILRKYETLARRTRSMNNHHSPKKAKLDSSSVVIADVESNNNKDDQDNKPIILSKNEFENMQICGQFNLGFILALSRDTHHLWILDQHACDEKYNFENYVKNSIIHEQKLIKPLPLELSASEENCVLENMDVFRRNGFSFTYDSDKPLRHRLALTALPHSGSGGGQKAVIFGPEDVGTLCAILGADGAYSSSSYAAGGGNGADGSGSLGNNAVRRYAGGTGHDLSLLTQTSSQSSNKQLTGGIQGSNLARLPKAIAMFASRACRSSIMIGDALSRKQMESVVNKMKGVDQPWDCPHGRPTIRHVTNLGQTLFQDALRETKYYKDFDLEKLKDYEKPVSST